MKKRYVKDAYGQKIDARLKHQDTVMGNGTMAKPLIVDSPVGYEMGQQLDKILTKAFDKIDRGIDQFINKDQRYKQKLYNRFIDFIASRYEQDLDYHFNKSDEDD